jgi:hypothetical protein
MKKTALALVLATLGTGCIITDSDGGYYGYGDLNLYWEFVRTRADLTTVLYDPVDSAPAGTGSCVDSGVDVIRVTLPDSTYFDWDCRYQGVQGVTLQGVPSGSVQIRVTGYRGVTALYDSTMTVSVPDGAVGSATAQVYGIPSNLDVYARFLDQDGTVEYATCALAVVEEFTYALVDWAGTVVASGTVSCTDPAGVSFRAGQALDRDLYAVRMQGFVSPTATEADFDSASTVFACAAQEFAHYGVDDSWDVWLYDVTANPTLCP